MKRLWKRILAVMLVAALCLAPAAQALTTDQLKDLLGKYYINDIPQAALDAETIEEVIQALGDPYTMYLTPEEYAAFQASMSDQEVVGIGISAVACDDGLSIVGVYDGAPAQKLGLVGGDTIISVEGKSAAGQTAEVITGWLKGEAGSKVTFVVRHADGTEETYTATRAKVVIPSTTTEMLEDGTTGYIVCNTFGAETLGHFTEGTQAYDDANLWVVDLRQNGGGDVYAVTQTLGVFLGEGTMVYLRDGEGAYFRYVSQQDRTTLYPTIVLTSGGTASSAEIFSLAMKDKNGGMVIGSNTFGKGVAQVVLTGAQEPEALTDGDALRITAYQYYGVSGNTAQNIGVIPDLLVDTNHADEIASLFSVNEPWQSTEGWLRVHLGGWRWYIDLSKAMGEEMAPYFAEMLSALPPAVDIFVGDGEGWVKSTPAQIAADTQVKGYAPRVFSDVAGTKYELAANTLCTYGMLRGYADGTFRPESGLTRAELCALLTQTMRLHLPETGATFSDVAKDSWYAPYIQAAQAAGYVSGVGNGRFDPQGKVTQEQMMTVLGRLAADLNLNFLGASNAVPEDTGISSKYSTWAQPWVWLLEKSQKNILGQPLSMLYASSDSIDPKAPATRGQTAQILYTLFTAVELLSSAKQPLGLLLNISGRFEETRQQALIEMGINLLVSVMSVLRFGIAGCLFGTLAAHLYRYTALILFTRTKVLGESPVGDFVRLGVNGLLCFVLLYLLGFDRCYGGGYLMVCLKGALFGLWVLPLFLVVNAVLDWRNVDTLRGLLHTLTIKKGATEEKHDAE